MSSHELDRARTVAGRIVTVAGGVVVADPNPADPLPADPLPDRARLDSAVTDG
jgi:hypothetical protein